MKQANRPAGTEGMLGHVSDKATALNETPLTVRATSNVSSCQAEGCELSAGAQFRGVAEGRAHASKRLPAAHCK